MLNGTATGPLSYAQQDASPTLLEQLLALGPTLFWLSDDATESGGNVTGVPAAGESSVAYEQGTEAQQPTYVATHPNFGGLPGIEIDDAAANLVEVTTGAIGTLTDAVICWVVDLLAVPAFGATDWLILDGGGAAQVYTARNATGTAEIGIYDGTAHRVVEGITVGVHYLTAVCDATAGTVQFRIDGEDVGAAQTYDGSIAFTGKAYLSYNGGAAANNGSIYGGAVIIESATDAARDAAEAFIADHFAFPVSSYDLQAPQYVVGVGGQSNPALGDATAAEHPRIRAWDKTSGTWLTADSAGPADLFGVVGGIAASFAYETCVRNGNLNKTSVGIINNPLSGTAIADLLPGSTLYDDWATEVAASGRMLDAYLWWQGESDDGRSEVDHLADLETLYAAVMALATSAALFIVFDLVSDTACGATDLSGVSAALASFTAAHSNVRRITSSDLPNDGCHLTAAGRVTAGQRVHTATFG